MSRPTAFYPGLHKNNKPNNGSTTCLYHRNRPPLQSRSDRFTKSKMPSNVPISNFPCHSIIQRTELLLNPLFKLVYEVTSLITQIDFIQSAILTTNPYLLLIIFINGSNIVVIQWHIFRFTRKLTDQIHLMVT